MLISFEDSKEYPKGFSNTTLLFFLIKPVDFKVSAIGPKAEDGVEK